MILDVFTSCYGANVYFMTFFYGGVYFEICGG